jgi:hypothetical protein
MGYAVDSLPGVTVDVDTALEDGAGVCKVIGRSLLPDMNGKVEGDLLAFTIGVASFAGTICTVLVLFGVAMLPYVHRRR